MDIKNLSDIELVKYYKKIKADFRSSKELSEGEEEKEYDKCWEEINNRNIDLRRY